MNRQERKDRLEKISKTSEHRELAARF